MFYPEVLKQKFCFKRFKMKFLSIKIKDLSISSAWLVADPFRSPFINNLRCTMRTSGVEYRILVKKLPPEGQGTHQPEQEESREKASKQVQVKKTRFPYIWPSHTAMFSLPSENEKNKLQIYQDKEIISPRSRPQAYGAAKHSLMAASCCGTACFSSTVAQKSDG